MNQKGPRADVQFAMELGGKKRAMLRHRSFSCARLRLKLLDGRPVIGRCRFQRNNVASGLQRT